MQMNWQPNDTAIADRFLQNSHSVSYLCPFFSLIFSDSVNKTPVTNKKSMARRNGLLARLSDARGRP
jgi:hypothetical protein